MNILKCVILSATKWSRKISTYALCAVLFAFLACTDYVAEIDDQIKDLKAQWDLDEYPDDVDDFAEEASSSSESRFNPNIEYGKLTDSRDGQTYKTVTIGDQVWMAENLNYVADSSFCYNNEKSNCDKYGRLYTWAAATTACPSGWHLPSKAEWETLFNAVGNQSTAGKVLKSTSGWSYSDAKSTDAFGFSALPAGYYGQGYYSEGFSAFFWISTENDSFRAYYMYLLHDDDSANLNKYGKRFRFSVRCLKDDGVMPESSSSSKVTEPAEETSSSSGILESSSSVSTNIEYGKLTDSRDNQTYRTVIIGSQTWMAENLNFKTDSSFCYNNDENNCNKFGRLYTWAAATMACPSGWHLPSKAEWETLFNAVGSQSTAGKELKSTSGWTSSGNGTDAFGFSALPAGYRPDDGYYDGEGGCTDLWSSTEYDSDRAFSMNLSYDGDGALLSDCSKTYYMFSVRCLQDDASGQTERSSSSKTEKFSSSSAKSNSSEKLSSSSVTPKSSSSNSSTKSSSSSVVIPGSIGNLTDSRDGQTYKTVKIGEQVWMAENLNYEAASSYCYSNDATNCTKYGRLYTWMAASSACPDGWHLPSEDEWETLFTNVGGQSTAGKVLKSTSGWIESGYGTDSLGFSALPAGYRDMDGNYNLEGERADFWSSTELNSRNAYVMYLFYYDAAAYLDNFNKNYGFFVRCLKDNS